MTAGGRRVRRPLWCPAATSRSDPRAAPGQPAPTPREGTMDRHPSDPAPQRTFAGLEDARDLRAAIAAALGTTPLDEQLLRDGIWTYVGAERDAGVPPDRVISALAGIIAAAPIASVSAAASLQRRV